MLLVTFLTHGIYKLDEKITLNWTKVDELIANGRNVLNLMMYNTIVITISL